MLLYEKQGRAQSEILSVDICHQGLRVLGCMSWSAPHRRRMPGKARGREEGGPWGGAGVRNPGWGTKLSPTSGLPSRAAQEAAATVPRATFTAPLLQSKDMSKRRRGVRDRPCAKSTRQPAVGAPQSPPGGTYRAAEGPAVASPSFQKQLPPTTSPLPCLESCALPKRVAEGGGGAESRWDSARPTRAGEVPRAVVPEPAGTPSPQRQHACLLAGHRHRCPAQGWPFQGPTGPTASRTGLTRRGPCPQEPTPAPYLGVVDTGTQRGVSCVQGTPPPPPGDQPTAD